MIGQWDGLKRIGMTSGTISAIQEEEREKQRRWGKDQSKTVINLVHNDSSVQAYCLLVLSQFSQVNFSIDTNNTSLFSHRNLVTYFNNYTISIHYKSFLSLLS